MISDDGRDRIAAEELAAGEDRRGGAQVVAVGHHLGAACRPGMGASGWLVLERVVLRPRQAGLERPLVARHDLLALLGEALSQAGADVLGRQAEPAGHQAEHDRVLRLLGAGGLLGHRLDGHRHDLGRLHAGHRDLVGRDARVRVVDDDGVAVDGQFGAELQEVVPVERDGDVERAAGPEHRAAWTPAGGTTTRRRESGGRSSW